MATQTAKNASGDDFTFELPLTPGRAAAASSRPVALSSEDFAVIDGIEALVAATNTALGTVNTNLGTIDGRVDTLETLIASTNTKLDTVITSVQLLDNAIAGNEMQVDIVSGSSSGTEYTEDAAAASNPIGGMLIARRRDTLSTTEVSADGDNIALNATNKGELRTSDTDVLAALSALNSYSSTFANYRLLSSAATTNGANIKSSGGSVAYIQGYNGNAAARYLKIYNKATAPTVGTDTPVATFRLPPTSDFIIGLESSGLVCAIGIGVAITGAAADADTTAISSGDIVCLNIGYT